MLKQRLMPKVSLISRGMGKHKIIRAGEESRPSFYNSCKKVVELSNSEEETMLFAQRFARQLKAIRGSCRFIILTFIVLKIQKPLPSKK